jgi:hypothetical protein
MLLLGSHSLSLPLVSPKTQQSVIETCRDEGPLTLAVQLWLGIAAIIHTLVFLKLRQNLELPFAIAVKVKLDNTSTGVHAAYEQQRLLWGCCWSRWRVSG